MYSHIQVCNIMAASVQGLLNFNQQSSGRTLSPGLQLHYAGKNGNHLSSCRNIPEESNIYAHGVNTGSQRYLKISTLYYARNATEHGPVCCHDKAHFPIPCWQYDVACFSSCPTSRDVAIDCLPERLSVCSPYSWLCTFLSHCVSTIHIILSSLLSSLYLDALFHYIRFTPKPLSSVSAHISVLTDSLGPSMHEVWGKFIPVLDKKIHGWVDVGIHVFLNSQLDGKSWTPSPCCFTLGENVHDKHWIRDSYSIKSI